MQSHHRLACMVRKAMATTCMLVIASFPALTQTPPIGAPPGSAVPAAPEPTAAGVDLSPQAAGIDRIVASDIQGKRADAGTSQTAQPAKQKNWFARHKWATVAILAGAGLATYFVIVVVKNVND